MKIKKYILAFCLYISCSNTDKEYAAIGVIQDIKEDQNTIIIDHDSIPGFMMPMVMPFNFEHKKDVLGLSIGDSVKFKLVVTIDNSYACDFTVLGRSEIIGDYDDLWDDDEYRQKSIGETLTDISLIDMNNDSISLSSLNEKFRFISFIFTDNDASDNL